MLPNREKRKSGDKTPGTSNRKGPQFNIYWLYAIILVFLIGSSLFGPLTPNMAKINELDFKNMVKVRLIIIPSLTTESWLKFISIQLVKRLIPRK